MVRAVKKTMTIANRGLNAVRVAGIRFSNAVPL
jgi:hypothetical protein